MADSQRRRRGVWPPESEGRGRPLSPRRAPAFEPRFSAAASGMRAEVKPAEETPSKSFTPDHRRRPVAAEPRSASPAARPARSPATASGFLPPRSFFSSLLRLLRLFPASQSRSAIRRRVTRAPGQVAGTCLRSTALKRLRSPRGWAFDFYTPYRHNLMTPRTRAAARPREPRRAPLPPAARAAARRPRRCRNRSRSRGREGAPRCGAAPLRRLRGASAPLRAAAGRRGRYVSAGAPRTALHPPAPRTAPRPAGGYAIASTQTYCATHRPPPRPAPPSTASIGCPPAAPGADWGGVAASHGAARLACGL